MTSLRDKLVSLFTLKGYGVTVIDRGFTRLVPRTTYSETVLWIGPNGEMRAGDGDLMDSVSLSEVRWDNVVEMELSKVRGRGDSSGQGVHC